MNEETLTTIDILDSIASRHGKVRWMIRAREPYDMTYIPIVERYGEDEFYCGAFNGTYNGFELLGKLAERYGHIANLLADPTYELGE